jgi:hypothetical protein
MMQGAAKMFENEMQTRAAICGTGILLAIIFLAAHLPVILLVAPVAILFLGVIADPEETHAVWYGMLNVLGIFDISGLTDAEKKNHAEKKLYFWFGEVGMAAILAGVFAFPAGMYLAGRAEIPLAFTGALMIFLLLFIFLPKILRKGMREDTDAVIDAFGKNEHVRKVFWTVFVTMAGLVVTRVLDPGTAQQIISMITGSG